jgi:predicted permease
MKKQNKIYWIVGAVVIILALVIIFRPQSEEEKYTIGVVTSLTGNGSNLGIPWMRGMELAAEEINKGGVSMVKS